MCIPDHFMKANTTTKLRIERSMNCSGVLLNIRQIPILKEKDYFVESIALDGDAPKQLIRLYDYQEDSGIKRHNPTTWLPFIAKTAEKWYPHESVIEYMINKLGIVLGMRMNEVRLLRINGQIRFLSRFFLRKGESLIHGAEICGEFLEDMELAKQIADEKKSARELFTFEFIENAIKAIFPNSFEEIIHDLVKMLTFDALVGNNDRHFYNWGIITNKRKINKIPKFAPIYDSARGLLWNISDENVIKWHKMQSSGGKQLAKYVREACPRISIEGDSEIDHVELIEFLKKRDIKFKETIELLASLDQENLVLTILEKEFYPFFIKERGELITQIIKERFKKIREA